MAWSLASIVIHPQGDQVSESVESNYSIQKVLDAVVETISYFGANSNRITLEFTMFESENASAGRTTLLAAAKADANVNLTGDLGSMGNFRILSLNLVRKMDAKTASAAYAGSAELIAS